MSISKIHNKELLQKYFIIKTVNAKYVFRIGFFIELL